MSTDPHDATPDSSPLPIQATPPNRVDRLGGVVSTLCATHCLLCAVAPGLLTLLGLGALLSHEAEWGFTLAAAVLAGTALLIGRRHHGSFLVTATFILGIVGLLASRLLEEKGFEAFGPVLGVSAGIALVAGHLFNLRATQRARSMAKLFEGHVFESHLFEAESEAQANSAAPR